MSRDNKRKGKNRFRNKVLGITLALVMILGVVSLADLSKTVQSISNLLFPTRIVKAQYAKYDVSDYTKSDGSGRILIESWTDFENYSKAYYEASQGTYGPTVTHKNDVVLLAMGSGSLNTYDLSGNYEPIGNDDAPFEGKFLFASGSPDTFNIDRPLFGTVSEKVTITESDGTTLKKINITRTADSTGVPLFAEKVKSDNDDNTNANWSFVFKPYDSSRDTAYGGAITEIESGAGVTLIMENNGEQGKTHVKSNADVGVLCGKLGAGAILNATYSGSNLDYMVISNGGNAGGLVGSMETGSVFTVSASKNLQSTADTLVKASGYAGGVVGKNVAGTVTTTCTGESGKYDINQLIVGGLGSGGLFGCYKAPAGTSEMDVSGYSVNCKVSGITSGAGSSGGLIGEMESNSGCNITIKGVTGGTTITSDHNSGTDAYHDAVGVKSARYGGLIGKYKASSTSDTLTIKDLKATASNTLEAEYFGGGISVVDGASYVKFDGFELSSALGNLKKFGGLVSSAKKGYIYAQAVKIGTASSKINNFGGGGLVGWLDDGVLGMTGAIDVSNATASSSETVFGQLVGSRDNAFIYAENLAANESNPAVTWNYTPNSAAIDNVGSWGDVLVFDGTHLSKGDVISSETNHIITLESVNVSSETVGTTTTTTVTIANTSDYANASLYYQIDSSKNSFITNFTMIPENAIFTFTDNVDLTATGLRGITRDNGSSRVSFTGSISATSGKMITLDIRNVGGTNRGVYRHIYNGMIGIANGATFEDVTMSGSILSANAGSTAYVGSLASRVNNSLIVTDCSTSAGLNISMTGSVATYGGRLVGNADKGNSGMGNISVSGCTFDGTISGDSKHTVGGFMGKIDGAASSAQWSFNDVTLMGTVKGISLVGGLIAEVVGEGKATINLGNTSEVVVDGMTVEGNSSDYMGGLLGYSWSKTDVNIKNVSVSNTPFVNQKSSGGSAGLVYRATGHWVVNNLDLRGIKMKSSAGSVGMIVNKGKDGSDGIYLELPKNYNYKLSFAAGTDTGSGIFDEICAYSADSSSNIMKNGQGIVSISTYDGTNDTSLKLKMGNDDNTNTGISYKAQTTQGEGANPNTRYYYNLDLIDTDNDGDRTLPAEKMMSWGLNCYAANNIKKYFKSYAFSSNTFYDLRGYSWYPVTLDKALTVAGNFKLYNEEFTITESAKTTDNKWLPLSSNQHYMMHNALFYDVNADLTIGAIQLSGTIGEVNKTSGTGALVYGTVKGSKTETSTNITTIDSTSGSIVLNGIRIWNLNSDSNYSPLLINKASDYVALNISNVSNTSAYMVTETVGEETTTTTISAATSLIGQAGTRDTATESTQISQEISVTFEKIKLDGRDSENNSVYDSSRYNTTKSIFTRATLLEKLVGSSGTYNFNYDLDWGTGTPHTVTYGKELGYISEGQYPSLELYYQSSSKYVRPDASAGVSAQYTGYSYFLPYVKDVNTKDQIVAKTGNKYQLMVNHQPSDRISGCGTYNDPYIIKSAQDLINISKWIKDGAYFSGDKISVDSDGDGWCNNKPSGHVTYTCSSGGCTPDTGSTNMTANQMRAYLAKAYYLIQPEGTTSITIPVNSEFQGLGTNPSPYRFSGVIVGAGSGVTIINQTLKPLINFSDGSVVKNISIKVDLQLDSNTLPKAENSFTFPSTNNYAYGAVFGQIIGGDNIIEAVQVTFGSNKLVIGGNCAQLMPVGGYIGVVLNGGVIFRKMSGNITGLTNDNIQTTSGFNASSVKENLVSSSNDAWLYVNPIIGRVINGYAVTESTSYQPREADVKMKNSTDNHDVVKNYSITDITSSGSALSVNTNDKKITVPDSQSMYVMSLIINSGMGSNKLGYASGSSDTFMRRHALYSDIGTGATSKDACPDYNTKANIDSVSSVPYLIYAYAGENAPIGKNDWDVVLSGSNYNLPDGFRGIGNFINNDNELRLNAKSFGPASNDNTNKTINQNTKYYYYLNDNYKPVNSNTSGLGLFNNQPYSGTKFNNFTLSGNVKSCVLTYEGVHIPYNNKDTSNNHNQILSVGALLGTVNVNVTIENVNLNGINVSSSRNAGGMIGMSQGSGITISIINNADSSDITVIGGLTTGGLIGQRNQTWSEIGPITIDFNNHDFKIREIKCISTADVTQNYYGVGGLIGAARCNSKDTLLKNYLNVSNIRMVNYVDGEYGVIDGGKFYTGGIIGSPNRAPMNITNCVIENISCKANGNVGGITGGLSTISPATIKNTHIKNTISGKTPEISGTNSTGSGGFLGGTVGTEISSVTIENSSISGYIISASTNAGGIIGNRTATSPYAKTVNHMIIKDVSIKDCFIRADSNLGSIAGSVDFNDILGYNILTDNITFQKKNETQTNFSNLGYIIGKLDTGNARKVRLVGFSRQRVQVVGSEKNVGSSVSDKDTNRFGTGGYVIFADYQGDVSNHVWPTSEELVNSSKRSEDNKNVTPTDPYVITNSKSFVDGTQFLTGDGADVSAIRTIFSDIENTGTGYYASASDKVSNVKYSLSFKDEMGTKTYGNPKDFPVLIVEDTNYQNTTDRINDYIALLTNTTPYNRDTGVGYNYAAYGVNTDLFRTVIYKCAFDTDGTVLTIKEGDYNEISGSSTAQNSTPCLKRNSTQFYMNAKDTDTAAENAQFTLIDVQYYDPSGTGDIVYHLYIPVYVRKILEYDFNIHVESGTSHKINTPANISKNTLVENIGVPVTLEFAYTYKRTKAEWISAANSGDSLLANYPKTLMFDNSTSKVGLVQPNFPGTTKMVLVDTQNNSKAYYLDNLYEEGNEAFSGTGNIKTLDLSKFTNGTAFSTVNFNDMMQVTVTQSDNGFLVKTSEYSGIATLKDNSGATEIMYRPMTEAEKNLAEGQTGYIPKNKRYSVESITYKDNEGDYLIEHYFLTIYTEYSTNASVYHYAIGEEKTLGSDPYPSRISAATENNMANLFLGNIYTQNVFIEDLRVGDEPDNYCITSTNNQLSAVVSANVGLTDAAIDNDIKTYLGSTNPPKVYESLLLQFDKHTNSSSDIGVKGVEDADVFAYTVTANNITKPITYYNPSWNKVTDTTVNSTYIEMRNNHSLAKLLSDYGSVSLNASVTITFDSENGGITEQFYPETPVETNRTRVIAISRMASASNQTAYSKVSVSTNVKRGESEPNEYYTTDTEEATLVYEASEIQLEGAIPQLGINANDPEDIKKFPAPISTIASYNVDNCQTAWNTANYIRCEIELKSIDDNYSSSKNIYDYLKESSFTIFDGVTPVSTAGTTGNKLVFLYSKSSLEEYYQGNTYQIPIDFEVYSGDDFEADTLKYANYGIFLTVSMMADTTGEQMQVRTDYVKYTNAKVYIVEKIDASKANP